MTHSMLTRVGQYASTHGEIAAGHVSQEEVSTFRSSHVMHAMRTSYRAGVKPA